MAQNFTAVKKTGPRTSIGSRFQQVVELTFGTEYKAKGVEITKAQLEEAGLPDGIVDVVIPISEVSAAGEGTEALAPSVVLKKPGESGAKALIQLFGSGAAKKEAAFELADKAATASGWIITVLIQGR